MRRLCDVGEPTEGAPQHKQLGSLLGDIDRHPKLLSFVFFAR